MKSATCEGWDVKNDREEREEGRRGEEDKLRGGRKQTHGGGEDG